MYKITNIVNGKIYIGKTKENLKLAQGWLESVKNGELDTVNKYNKPNDLPQNISQIRDKKDKNLVIGYRAHIMTGGKSTNKSFQSKSEELSILLQKAIDYKTSVNAK